MKYKEIAVIGISGRFAGTGNIAAYRELLRCKKSVIGPPPSSRLELMKQDPDDTYMPCGYLEDISSFDNQYFDVSKREARLMSPEQRISLELAAEAILDAGYSLQSFRGANCGVYVAEGESEYNRFVEKQSSSSIIGSRNFMLSGQLGYHFDLRGENLSINSGCSSSLLAVHYACQKITLGEVDTALVGGVTLEVTVPQAKKNQYDVLGIMSPDYNIRSFDEQANGTVRGEGGGYVLLKSLEQAERDGDHIYGVLLSGAVNGDGGRCTSVSMPSVEAQGDVVLKAWADAEVGGMTEIEAHGIGAPVGDAVEAQSLIDAVIQTNLTDNQIKVSTVKSNIGHLFPLSGIASLVKTLIGYQYRETYPIAALETVNPLIRFDDAGLEPLREVYHWEPDAARMTGISSFGLNGCNTHIVLRNDIRPAVSQRPSAFLKLSARTPTAFTRLKRNLLSHLRDENCDLGNLIYTLNVGRDDYAFRGTVPVTSLAGLQNALETVEPTEVQEAAFRVLFAVKTEAFTPSSLESYTVSLPALNACQTSCTGNPDIDFKLALYHALTAIGIKGKTMLFDRVFSTAVKLQAGKCSRETFERVLSEWSADSDYSGYLKQVAAKDNGKPLIVIDFTRERGMASVASDHVYVFHIQEADELARLIRFWYEAGLPLSWSAYYENRRLSPGLRAGLSV